jgi:AcrR family transcriptional regulator
MRHAEVPGVDGRGAPATRSAGTRAAAVPGRAAGRAASPPASGRKGPAEPGRSQRDRIRQTAATLFVRRGYQVTSMKQLATALGMVPANLYNYYPSKQAILFDVLDAQLTTFIARQSAIVKSGRDPVETLRGLAYDLVMEDLQDPFAATLTHHALEWLTGRARKQVRKQLVQVREMWLDTVRKGQKAGRFHPGRPNLATLTILTLCSFVSNWFDPAGALSAHEVADYTAAAVLRCVGHVAPG